MCLVVYVGSDSALPEIEWSESAPAFHVRAVEDDAPVRRQFEFAHAYELGSHEGCGCGFVIDYANGAQEEANRSASVSALHDYLASNLTKGRLRLFICWADTESLAPETARSVALDALLEPEFWTRVHSSAISDHPTAWELRAAVPNEA